MCLCRREGGEQWEGCYSESDLGMCPGSSSLALIFYLFSAWHLSPTTRLQESICTMANSMPLHIREDSVLWLWLWNIKPFPDISGEAILTRIHWNQDEREETDPVRSREMVKAVSVCFVIYWRTKYS